MHSMQCATLCNLQWVSDNEMWASSCIELHCTLLHCAEFMWQNCSVRYCIALYIALPREPGLSTVGRWLYWLACCCTASAYYKLCSCIAVLCSGRVTALHCKILHSANTVSVHCNVQWAGDWIALWYIALHCTLHCTVWHIHIVHIAL